MGEANLTGCLRATLARHHRRKLLILFITDHQDRDEADYQRDAQRSS